MRLKICLLVAALLLPAAATAQETKAYKLQFGDVSIEINPGETLDVTLPDGSKTKVTLTRNAFATYSAAAFSFVHPSDVSVTLSDLGDGIIQHLMATAVGTIVIVQAYSTLDPTSLNQLMLQEMTKEAVAAGAEVTQQPATRQTPGGKTLNGLTATEAGKNDTADYEILAYGNSGADVQAITRIDQENATQDGPMLAKFWESFELK